MEWSESPQSEEPAECDSGDGSADEEMQELEELPSTPAHTAELVIQAACWNIHGLADYKQADLLALISGAGIDVLAVCETHLVNPEQLVRWERQVQASARYVWFGRPAVRLSPGEHGRGSGGAGILIRSEWAQHTLLLPECEHDRLLFVRLTLPGAPFSIFIGVAYLVPLGSLRAAENSSVLDELEERAERYQSQGNMVLVMGDFNVHIAERASALSLGDLNFSPDLYSSDLVRRNRGSGVALARQSVDASGTDCPGRVSAAGAAFVDRMDAAGLVILNGLCDAGDGMPALATYGLSSVIDFILVDSAHWHLMDSVSILPDARAEVSSDHQLVTTAVRFSGQLAPISAEPLNPIGAASMIRSVRYNTESRGDLHYWDGYESECSRLLGALASEWQAARYRGERQSVEATWSAFNSCVDRIAKSTIGMLPAPRDSVAIGPSRGGRPVFFDADPALRVWKRRRRKLGQALTALLPHEHERFAELRALERTLSQRIKNHVRKAVRARENREIAELAQLRSGQVRAHWQALFRIGNIRPQLQPAPSVAVDSSGVSHSTPAGVRDVWLDFWSSLAKHDPADPRFDLSFHAEVQQNVAAREAEMKLPVSERPPLTAAQLKSGEALNCPITLREVSDAVSRLLDGKAPGCDGVVSEVLKNGGRAMNEALRELCAVMFGQSEVPADWLRGVIVPIHKDSDVQLPANYRPITLLSIVGKVYTGVLQRRLMDWSEANGIVVEEQGGFRPGRGCPEQLYALTELIHLRRLRKRRTFACFIDIRKAYDTVWHEGLKLRLLECGIHGSMYRALCSLYSGGESTVRLRGEAGFTDFFPINTGVRQGCILSPLLYSIFINGLALLLKAQGLGAAVDAAGTRRICVLLYADDIVLLAEDASDLEELMDTVREYAHMWRFDVNHAKCGAMRFNVSGCKLPSSPPLSIGLKSIPWIAAYKYLGVELRNGPGRPYRLFHQRMLAGARGAAGRIAGMGMYSGKLTVPLGVQVYHSLVRPLLEFAAEVWSANHPWPDAELLQLRVAKRILQCPIRTAGLAVMGELGWSSMEARWQQLRVGFWSKILRMSPDSPTRLVYDESIRFYNAHACESDAIPTARPCEGWQVFRAPIATAVSSLWCAQLQRDLFTIGLEQAWNHPASVIRLSQIAWKERVRVAVSIREQSRWWSELQRKPILATYVSLKQSTKLQMESYLCVSHGGWNDRVRRGRIALTQLRTASNLLRIHTGRWDKLDEQHRLCELCAAGVDTEEHFLLRCSFFQHERAALFAGLESLVNSAATAAESAASPAASSSSPWRVLDESAESQLQLLTCTQHPRIPVGQLQRRVHRLILIAVGEWMQQHDDHRRRVRSIIADE